MVTQTATASVQTSQTSVFAFIDQSIDHFISGNMARIFMTKADKRTDRGYRRTEENAPFHTPSSLTNFVIRNYVLEIQSFK